MTAFFYINGAETGGVDAGQMDVRGRVTSATYRVFELRRGDRVDVRVGSEAGIERFVRGLTFSGFRLQAL